MDRDRGRRYTELRVIWRGTLGLTPCPLPSTSQADLQGVKLWEQPWVTHSLVTQMAAPASTGETGNLSSSASTPSPPSAGQVRGGSWMKPVRQQKVRAKEHLMPWVELMLWRLEALN